MSLPIGLNGIAFRALLTLPLLLAVLSRIVLFDSGEVAQGPRRVVVNASWFGAEKDFSLRLFFVALLLKLPRQVVASSVKL